MKWVDTDRNAYLRRENDNVSVPCTVQQSTGWLWKFRDDRRTPHRFSSWRCGLAQYRLQLVRPGPRLHSLLRFSRTDTFQAQEIDRILLYRIPAGGTPEEGIPGGETLAIRYERCRTSIVASIEKHVQKVQILIEQILPTLFTLRDNESRNHCRDVF